ncbi:hypothetical protein BH09VER1_BH09VER1_05730 [soil metagenome]
MPAVWDALFAALAASTLFFGALLLWADGLKVFTAQFWRPDGKLSAVELLPGLLAICVAIGLVPAVLVLVAYQNKLRKKRSVLM